MSTAEIGTVNLSNANSVWWQLQLALFVQVTVWSLYFERQLEVCYLNRNTTSFHNNL